MFRNILVRLVVHYASTLLLLSGLMRLFPSIAEYQVQERMRVARSSGASLDGSTSAEISGVIGIARLFDAQTSVPVLMAMVIAFLMTLPVTWVYRWTRPAKRYSQSLAHTLLLVPIAIALAVFLVKGSLALAFSLAGIVAAVRFRTSLDDPLDAVYMFIVIGIGLAAGVQLNIVAFLASIFFISVALMIWRMDFGAQPAVLRGWSIVPTDEAGHLLGPGAESTANGGENPSAEKSLYNSMLRVYTINIEVAQRAVFPILERSSRNWRMSQVTKQEDGSLAVDFDLRLRKSVNLAAFVREIEQSSPTLGAVELKKAKGPEA